MSPAPNDFGGLPAAIAAGAIAPRSAPPARTEPPAIPALRRKLSLVSPATASAASRTAPSVSISSMLMRYMDLSPFPGGRQPDPRRHVTVLFGRRMYR